MTLNVRNLDWNMNPFSPQTIGDIQLSDRFFENKIFIHLKSILVDEKGNMFIEKNAEIQTKRPKNNNIFLNILGIKNPYYVKLTQGQNAFNYDIGTGTYISFVVNARHTRRKLFFDSITKITLEDSEIGIKNNLFCGIEAIYLSSR